MFEFWSRFTDFLGALTGDAACRARRAARRRDEAARRAEQALTIDRLKALGVRKFRWRAVSVGAPAEEAVGFLGELRFVVGPHGSIRLEGYVDPDKAMGLARLYQ